MARGQIASAVYEPDAVTLEEYRRLRAAPPRPPTPSTRLATSDRLCAVAGCDRTRHARRWCPRHYQQWRARGLDPQEDQ